MSKRTSLYGIHLGLGATMTDFAGWEMPLRYGSETVEHSTVRSAAGLFDLSTWARLRSSGRRAVRALDHAVVSDIGALGVTKAKYTMICQEDGGILDDESIQRLDRRLKTAMVDFEPAATLLSTIPGVSTTAAHVIIAETGADMTRFPTAAHLAS